MGDKAWKAAERRAARLLGAERNPLSGGNSGNTRSDTRHDRLYIEVKQRARHAVWSVYEQAKDRAAKEARIPVVVLDQVRKHGSIWCVHSNDLFAFAAAVLLSDPERAASELGWDRPGGGIVGKIGMAVSHSSRP